MEIGSEGGMRPTGIERAYRSFEGIKRQTAGSVVMAGQMVKIEGEGRDEVGREK
jgi:hypothetical protein